MGHDAAAVRRLLACICLVACSGNDRAPFASPDVAKVDGGATRPAKDRDDSVEVDSSSDSDSDPETDAGSSPAAPLGIDPESARAFSVGEATGTREGIAMHAYFPKTGDKAPIIVFAHGFQLPASQYEKPLKHLASHGYVTLTADYHASIGGGDDNATQASSLLLGIDWAKDDAKVGPHADVTRVGMSGHSLGGKLALLAATQDERVKAALVLDPVDGNGVDVAELLPDLHIPTGFLGETLDSSAGIGGQACAPKNSNFETFYAKANSPSLRVTIDGASHMSFIDDIASCGLTCSVCKKATASADDVAKLSRGFLVAFFERHLRQLTAYDAYLGHATDIAAIKSK